MTKRTAAAPGPARAAMRVHEYIARQVDLAAGMGSSQREIAKAMGYQSPNMISMLKTGAVKLPLDKVPSLARALNIDARFLLRLAMQQYWADDWDAIEEIFGTIPTANEVEILDVVRAATKNTDPAVTPDLERKIKAAFK